MRNIIIAGGGLVNKGAQAMTLICVCELKKRYPGRQILLLTWDTSSDARQRHAMYDLELLQIPPLKFSEAAHNPVKKAVFSLRYGKIFTEVDEIYRNTDLFLDISGYALGSNWDSKVCHDYLDNIEHALAYGIPVYLMPQSFGPFAFEGEAGSRIENRIRRLFPQVNKIFARERDGWEDLVKRYGLQNVALTHDMVLTSSIEDYSPAMKQTMQLELPPVRENSICLIPNVRVADYGVIDPGKLYRCVISAALSKELNVYITYHSTQDRALCASLIEAFAADPRVILLDRDHSCVEFNILVKQFRFVAASRFHAIVHALKNGIPCIALGWADKYLELMSLFAQERYAFDLRKPVKINEVESALSAMACHWQEESLLIRERLPALQQENVFDLIKEA